MKKIITLCVALIATIIVSAQQPMAILDHNDSISVFYGNGALGSAYNAAVSGDIITLSSGSFGGNFNMTKNNITIRGAGMQFDSVTMQEATYVNNSTYYYFSANNCTLEGLNINAISLGGTHSGNRILKCYIGTVNPDVVSYSGSGSGATFVGCKVGSVTIFYYYRGSYNSSTDNRVISNTMWNNCIIESITCSASGYNSPGIADVINWNNQFYHCVIGIDPYSATYAGEFYNSILYYTSTSNSCCSNQIAAYCIGIQNGTVSGYPFWNSTVRNNTNRTFSTTFTDFNGSNWETSTFTLTPEAQAILGLDSTQVGIYGGAHPYNPRVDAVPPIIGRVTVPATTNAEGRLELNVEIITDEE